MFWKKATKKRSEPAPVYEDPFPKLQVGTWFFDFWTGPNTYYQVKAFGENRAIIVDTIGYYGLNPAVHQKDVVMVVKQDTSLTILDPCPVDLEGLPCKLWYNHHQDHTDGVKTWKSV